MIVSYKTIGQNIRAARKAAGLTQEQIALIAQTLRVPLASLLNGCVMEEDFASEPDDSAQALGKSVAQLASGCSARTRRLMHTLCQAVASSEKLPGGE